MKVLVLIAILAILATQTYFKSFPKITVFAIGTPDAYGNVIVNLTIHQHNGTAWNELLFWDNDTDWSVRVEPDFAINLTLWVRLNNTLASSENQAVSFTRVFCNITDGGSIWNNVEFNNTDTGSDATYYYCQEQGFWNDSGYPATGINYNVNTTYDAFY